MKQRYIMLIVSLILVIVAVLAYRYYNNGAMLPSGVVQESSHVNDPYTNMNTDLYASIPDKEFVAFATSTIEKRCPFYKPDGATYRQCLSDWEQELSDAVIIELTDEVHNYCDMFTRNYADPESLEGMEMFLKCSIYQFSKP